jgi:TctA family transporter
MYFKDDYLRWAKGVIAFVIAAVAVWRSIVYHDPNPAYPAFASIFCGLFGLSVVITGLSIITKSTEVEAG